MSDSESILRLQRKKNKPTRWNEPDGKQGYVKQLEAENKALREALEYLYREANVTHKYVTSTGYGGITPLLSDAIEKAYKAINHIEG